MANHAITFPDTIEQRAIDALKAFDGNARTHSTRQIEQIAASMREWGWTLPVLIAEDNTIVAGHGRVRAARSLGLTTVPVLIARGWTREQIRAYVIADNRLAENAGWDDALLVSELQALVLEGFNVGLTGFSDADMDRLLHGARGRADEDDVPEVRDVAVTQPGDVWLLGEHRLMCGDATDPETVSKVLAGSRPNLMVTDPPYGVRYDADWRNRAIMVTGEKRGAHGSRSTGKVMNDERADWREAWALFAGDVAYVWHAGTQCHVVYESLVASGFAVRSQIIWSKSIMIISRGHYHHQHEPCYYAVRAGKSGHWNGGRKQTTLWPVEHRKSDTGHSTQKPVEVMRRPIENHTLPGERVYEPFAGSGTTLIAAESIGRVCDAIELNPAYVDVAVRRWQKQTERPAMRERDGLSFDEAANEAGIAAGVTADVVE